MRNGYGCDPLHDTYPLHSFLAICMSLGSSMFMGEEFSSLLPLSVLDQGTMGRDFIFQDAETIGEQCNILLLGELTAFVFYVLVPFYQMSHHTPCSSCMR